MRILRAICRVVLGILFVFSGFIKAIDPIGSALKIKEYFGAMHLAFMDFLSIPGAILLSTTEFIIGVAILKGLRINLFSKLALWFISFFTLLTLWIYLFNPVSDCGCFGEAIHLTHLETFVKNIILMALILIYYIPGRHLGETTRRKYISFGIVAVGSIAFLIYSLLYIPVIDFTAYKPRAELAIAASEGGNDLYESVFTYQKDGKTKQFTLEELPSDLDEWTFVGTETRFKGGINDHFIELSLFDPRTQSYADMIAALTVNDSFELTTEADYLAYKTALDSVVLKLTITEVDEG
jgi:uncharacterized membrane protein YphA (DoxX/SURF4 family)